MNLKAQFHFTPETFQMGKMDAEKKIKLLMKKYKSSNIDYTALIKLSHIQHLYDDSFFIVPKNIKKYVLLFILILFLYKVTALRFSDNDQCLVDIPFDSYKFFRKYENCDICRGVNKIDTVRNILQDDFFNLYVNNGKPVVVTDGALNWTALDVFDFEFFKNLYLNENNFIDDDDDMYNECQFFPYKTEFKSLYEVFNMSEERSRLERGTEPWYVGWSNCNNWAGKILREYYDRPYFLPKSSENIALSWIFMGGPGNGAHMHVDNVIHASWQAQLRGRKQWYLMPTPECYYQCNPLTISVNPVVVDTNRWYHQTKVLEGDISITIGSEFD